jgi:hypothetical protein
LAAICAVAVRQPLGGEQETAAASAGDPTMAATDGEAAGQAIDSPA